MVSEAACWSIAIVITGAVVSMLHTLGSAIHNQRHVDQVMAKVKRLKAQYAKRMAEIDDEHIIVVDEVRPESLAERQAA